MQKLAEYNAELFSVQTRRNKRTYIVLSQCNVTERSGGTEV